MQTPKNETTGSGVRADALLVARGLAPTRAKAQEAIRAGGVRANGVTITKAAQLIAATAALSVDPPYPWVSRAGVKLAFALGRFGVDPAGRSCLDIGASTGGFTDVLVSRGAAHVVAVDVGRDQLHPKLRANPRITSLEALDARALLASHLPEAPTLIVCDVSFIGLAKAIPTPLSLAAPGCDLIALIKPQFESGPRSNETIAPDEAAAIAAGTASAIDRMQGFRSRDLVESPIFGGAGATEFLLWARRD
jgi:23S rRNA (cytidine1920-2'-O)/16S rRNA (cytidine1409-2'-O)-methyltransferase